MRIPGLTLTQSLDELAWRSSEVEGVSFLVLHLEEPLPPVPGEGRRTRGGTVLIRMEPGVGYAPHRHVGSEDVLVLQGGYRDELGEHRAGDHVHYPPGSEHAPVALGERGRPVGETNPACILYTTAPLGVEVLDAGS